MFSGIFGYYYGRAKFLGHNNNIKKSTRKTSALLNIHKGLRVRWTRTLRFLKGKNLHEKLAYEFHQDELIAEGLIIATLLHAIFNFTLTLGVGYLIVPLLVLEYSIIAHEFHVHKNFVYKKTIVIKE